MLVHVEIPGMSLNLQDPLLRLTGIHPRQTGGPLFCQILTDFARGGRRANSTPGPARGVDLFGCLGHIMGKFSKNIKINLFSVTIRGMILKLGIHVKDLSLHINYEKVLHGFCTNG